MDVTEQWKARAELENAFEEIKQRTEALRRSEAYLAGRRGIDPHRQLGGAGSSDGKRAVWTRSSACRDPKVRVGRFLLVKRDVPGLWPRSWSHSTISPEEEVVQRMYAERPSQHTL